MSFWSKVRDFFGGRSAEPTSVPAPPSPGIPDDDLSDETPGELLQRAHISDGEYREIARRNDLVWEVWKERRIRELERRIVITGKSLRGSGRDAFNIITQWGTELEYLRPHISWRKDLETP